MHFRTSKAGTVGRVVVALLMVMALAGVLVITDAHPAAAVTQQQAIINAAVSQQGTPYCEGGGGIHGPSGGGACAPGVAGYDCMSLAQYAVYQGTGITVPLPPNADLPGPGTFIPPDGENISDLQPGDVVFFGGTSLGDYTHSGIYVGNGTVWDALEPGDTVQAVPFDTVYSDYGNVYQGAVQYWTAGANSSGPPPTYPTSPHGYDLVGSDGGVFVFGGNNGFHGSLPGLGISVNDITGMVATATDTGYFLVGADGGVFAFNAPFVNSLPGIGVHVNDIVGIVPTANDQGYFLVGRDGGVFAFNAPFENSLPGLGVHVNDIVGIAATPDDQGYWLVGADGAVYALGDATFDGVAPSGAAGITATTDGHGYWVVGSNGTVSPFGDAGNFSDLPNLGVSVNNIVGIVVTPDSQGYDLFGRDGGVFSFGDALNQGSLPGLGVQVDNIVGAVPT
jgi:cell wall-associated NlpC family hydrolase